MVKFTVQEVRRIMDHQNNIRNITVIAHVDHGKSTLSDSLVAKAGIISEKQAGNSRIFDKMSATGGQSEDRGITIKSTGVSMYYKYTYFGKEQQYLINLIDSPGHVDFSSQVTAALRVTDGALVIVDSVEGVCVQTQTVLRQAMQQRIRPVLVINKVDRVIHELQLSAQQIYQRFVKIIEKVNSIISTYQIEEQNILDPSKGNVVFAVGKENWAFSLSTFGQMYNKKEEALTNFMNKTWGDNFYDQVTKKWSQKQTNEEGKVLPRGFVKYIMQPICILTRSILKGQKQVYEPLLQKLAINLTQEQLKSTGKQLNRTIMSKWLPAADCLLETIIFHLPSPVVAQQYRTSYLYEGPNDDEVYRSMSACDPQGPLCVYISKMIPIDGNRFAAFGRVFSGTVKAGQKVRIMGTNFKTGQNKDLYEKRIGQVGVFMMSVTPEFIGDIPCGNTVAITGIDDFILKTGTIGSLDIAEPYPIRSMKYSVSAVYCVAVRPKKPADLPKFQKGLTRLSKSDPLLKVQIQETGQYIISGSGELHIQICLVDLRNFADCQIVSSPPVVTYKQTILSSFDQPCLTKSTNKHNRLYANIYPIKPELVTAIQNGIIDPKGDFKIRAEKLSKDFQWDKNQALKIWCFGPQNGANILVDCVKGAQYVNQIKDSVCTAFEQASKRGILADQNLRGCRFNLVDVKIHPDSVHRNGAQITPCAKRLFQGLQLSSRPTLLQPIFLCTMTAPHHVLGGIYETLIKRRGQVIEEVKIQDSPLHIVKAYLPVAQSFGFTSSLRANTQGMAFPENTFDHWQQIPGVPYEDNKATELVMQIRKRKGLKEEMPIVADYLDKL